MFLLKARAFSLPTRQQMEVRVPMNRLHCSLGIAKHRFRSKGITKECRKAVAQICINKRSINISKVMRLQS